MSCVNIKHPEFIKLKNQLDVDTATLEIVLVDWFSNNNTEEFPTENQIYDTILDKKHNSKPKNIRKRLEAYTDLFNYNNTELFMENLLDEVRGFQELNPKDRTINLRNLTLLYNKYKKVIGSPILLDELNNTPRALGVFRPENYSIAIDLEHIKKISVSEESVLRNIVHTVVHELTHALTEDAYANNLEFKTKIDDLYNYSKKYLNDKGLTRYYGLQDVYEFMAEATSNEIFQNILKTVPYKATNIFNLFFKYIIDILNLESDNALVEALNLVDEAVRTTFKTSRDSNGDVHYNVKRVSLYQTVSEFTNTLNNKESAKFKELSLNNKVIKNCK